MTGVHTPRIVPYMETYRTGTQAKSNVVHLASDPIPFRWNGVESVQFERACRVNKGAYGITYLAESSIEARPASEITCRACAKAVRLGA